MKKKKKLAEIHLPAKIIRDENMIFHSNIIIYIKIIISGRKISFITMHKVKQNKYVLNNTKELIVIEKVYFFNLDQIFSPERPCRKYLIMT